MKLPIRHSIKVILLNQHNQMLLMCADTFLNDKYYGKFWFPIGGGTLEKESEEEAAYREIYEETGIEKDEVQLGPVVWFGEAEFFLKGKMFLQKERFIVAKTKKEKVFLNELDDWEKKFVKEIKWFSLEDIKTSKDLVFPLVLVQYLPNILLGIYPKEPIQINIGKNPKQKPLKYKE